MEGVDAMRLGRMGRQVRRLTGCVTIALFAAALPVWAPGAVAGEGWSEGCTDGSTKPGGTEIPIVSSPVTLNLEAGVDNGGYVQVCYSTTAEGSSAPAVTGGMVETFPAPYTGHIACHDDDSPTLVAIECQTQDPNPSSTGLTYSASVHAQDLEVGIAPTGAELGQLDSVVCLRDVAVYTPVGSTGPVDLGACS